MVKTGMFINRTNTCLQSSGVELPLRDGGRLAARPITIYGPDSGKHDVKYVAISTRRTPTATAEPVKLEAYPQEGSPGDSNFKVNLRRANPTKLL